MVKREDIEKLSTFLSLGKPQREAVVMLFDGELTQDAIAKKIHVASSTVSTWKTKQKFNQARDEYNRYMLDELTSPAVLTLKDLLESESDTVRLGAAKDILDRTGYVVTQKQEITGELNTHNTNTNFSAEEIKELKQVRKKLRDEEHASNRPQESAK